MWCNSSAQCVYCILYGVYKLLGRSTRGVRHASQQSITGGIGIKTTHHTPHARLHTRVRVVHATWVSVALVRRGQSRARARVIKLIRKRVRWRTFDEPNNHFGHAAGCRGYAMLVVLRGLFMKSHGAMHSFSTTRRSGMVIAPTTSRSRTSHTRRAHIIFSTCQNIKDSEHIAHITHKIISLTLRPHIAP